jgi:type IX secretion system PorP/SprF family membrane protein
MKLHAAMIIILTLLPGLRISAQADISMATHGYNRANYNPASIARPDYLYLFSNARLQWVGVEGAPRIINVQASEYVHQLRSAFGLSVVCEEIGVTQALNPMITYAYRIARDPNSAISFGLAAGIFNREVNGSRFEAEIIADPSVDYSVNRNVRPDINAGVEYQGTHFVFGISSTHLPALWRTDNLLINTNHRYGYAIYKNTDLSLMNYSVGLQVVNRYNLTVIEGNVILRFKQQTGLLKGPRETFDIGLTCRSSRLVTLLAGLKISPVLRIGYAYDQSFIRGYSLNTTHEMMIEYRFLCKAASTRSACENPGFWYH